MKQKVAKSVGLGALFAILYGLVHDQITIRICPEYFTEFHPKVTNSTDLTTIALIWGVIATWWVGAIAGLGIGMAAFGGKRPPASWAMVHRTFAIVFGCSAVAATAAGLWAWKGGWEILERTPVYFTDGPEQSRSFYTCFAVHNASYTASLLAGLIGIWLLLRARGRLESEADRWKSEA